MQQTQFILLAFVSVLFISLNGNKYDTCTHAVYSETSNQAFCDFWYITESENSNELQLCDCKQNNDKYCISWICITISNYPFLNSTKSKQILNQILLPNNIDIYGVEECEYFTDNILISNNDTIKQFCYKYNNWQSCYCMPNENYNYCNNWICHKYVLDIDNGIQNENISIDIIEEEASQISNEEYECTKSYTDSTGVIDIETCIEWEGTLVTYDGSFASMNCSNEAWNSDGDIFTFVSENNITGNDLINTIIYKWDCDENEMSSSEFCRLCNNNTISEFICDSISDICGGWVVDVGNDNTLIIIVASVCGVVGCGLCVVALICLRKKCMKGRYGYLEGYELSKV